MEVFNFALMLQDIIIRFFGVITALMVIIFVHEMGHYLVARWCGITASMFSIGFGPELCHYTDKHGTRWRIALIPLGGYVRFFGDPAASSTSQKLVSVHERRPDCFAAANAWKRFATVFAGPFSNALFTVVVLALLFFSFGRTIVLPVVMDVISDSPAAQAGLRPGDKFLTMQGASVTSFDEIPRYVMTHDGEPIHFTIERSGQFFEVIVESRVERADDGFGNPIRIGRIGVIGPNNAENIQKIAYNSVEAIRQSVKETADIVQQTWKFLDKFIHGKGDRCQLNGPVRSAQIAWKVSDFGFLALLQLTAFFSISVGLFNLFPIPPLDGGHLIFYLAEGITGRPVPLRIQEIFSRIGLVLILFFMVFAILNNYIPC
ncbi:MAG: regulator of sigma E protease [Candidatus Tokpelaia sp. JSC189]|nr:MAG: regulator of sigma E protease [Candidatus Tokpelaia sp. JSC189]